MKKMIEEKVLLEAKISQEDQWLIAELGKAVGLKIEKRSPREGIVYVDAFSPTGAKLGETSIRKYDENSKSIWGTTSGIFDVRDVQDILSSISREYYKKFKN